MAKTTNIFLDRPFSLVSNTLLSVREAWSSNPESVKSDAVSPKARHRCDVSSELVAQDTASIMKISECPEIGEKLSTKDKKLLC